MLSPLFSTNTPSGGSGTDARAPLLDGGHPGGQRVSSLRASLRLIFSSSVSNVLFSFGPFGSLSGALGLSSRTMFLTNFLALMPLAALLSLATDKLSSSVGQTLGGLLNVTFGNAYELIVGIVALKEG